MSCYHPFFRNLPPHVIFETALKVLKANEEPKKLAECHARTALITVVVRSTKFVLEGAIGFSFVQLIRR